MATDPKAAVPVLVAAAAVHVLLAQHPELAALPIEWSFRVKDGITAYMPGYADDATEAATLIAGLLDAEVTGTEVTLSDGTRHLPRYITAELHGVPFFFSGRAQAEHHGGAS